MNKIVVERKMDGLANIIGEFVQWGYGGKNPSKKWADEKCTNCVPDEKFINAGFSGAALFPGDSGVEDVGKDGCCCGGNKSV